MPADWPLTILGLIDYFVQGVLLLLVLVHPWLVPRGRGARVLWYPLLVSVPWAVWRGLLFDATHHTSVPPFFYMLAGAEFGVIGLVLYGMRCFFTRSTPNSAPQRTPTAGNAGAASDVPGRSRRR